MNRVALFSFVLFALFLSCSAQSCDTYSFSNNAIYKSCNSLSELNSFLHWNYNSATRKLDIAYRHTGVAASKWVAWCINPTRSGMIGCQTLVAYQNSDGSMKAYTSSITNYDTSMAEGSLSFTVPNISATYANSEMIIFATIDLPSSMSTTVNHLWQDGPMNGGTPGTHSTSGANVRAKGSVDFLSGNTTSSSEGTDSKTRKRNVHGVLNVVSWGTLMPLGIMAARYLKVFKSANPAWFYLHVACQSSAYIVGVAGWATGISLGDDSGLETGYHGAVGLIIFVAGTLQVFALLLRPKPDHKYRFYWNIYHRSTGYLVIVLSIVNIFKGFDILDPEKKWKNTYIGILIFLGAVALVLEAITWIIVINRKKSESDKYHHGNGINGVNGYENGRSQA